MNPPLGAAAVICVQPPTADEVDDELPRPLGALLWDRPDALFVPMRPRQKSRARVSDLVSDILGLLGYTGAQPAVRKHLDADLFRALPFLHASGVTSVMIDQAEHLDQAAAEDLLAMAALLRVRLWLVWRRPPHLKIAELAGLHGLWVSFGEAREWWTLRPQPRPAECAATCLQRTTDCVTHGSAIACVRAGARHLIERDLATADDIRHRLVALSPFASEADRWALLGCMRDALRPAIASLNTVGVSAGLRLCDIALDGSTVKDDAAVHDLPQRLRPLIARQMIVALAAGQYAQDPLLYYFGGSRPLNVLTVERRDR
jgi:hypothetical protein